MLRSIAVRNTKSSVVTIIEQVLQLYHSLVHTPKVFAQINKEHQYQAYCNESYHMTRLVAMCDQVTEEKKDRRSGSGFELDVCCEVSVHHGSSLEQDWSLLEQGGFSGIHAHGYMWVLVNCARFFLCDIRR